ncbi:MAG: AMP-binding protein, partial [Candidatus Bathyarchaeota archaeon]|nr:AMP-binding protein [Candidatus Bathyarchaeota archaeon]
CMLTHYNLVSNAFQVALFSAIAWGLYDEENITLVHLPLYHSYGMTVCLNASVLGGGQIVIQKRFDPVEWLELIQKYKVNAVATVMPVISFYVKNPDLLKKYDLSSLKFVNNGAVPIMVEIAKEFEKLTGVTVTQGYGLSETSPVTNSNPKIQIKLESVGPPFPDTEEKIVDPDNPTKELPPGNVGELAIRGPQVMKGYWKKPEETAKVLTPDGWFLTGDLAKMDEDGYVYIIDRKKEIIKCMGFTIAPAELESILLEHPAVFDCAVVPKPDPEKVEVPKAYVALKPGYETSPKLVEELLKWVNSKVAGYKKICEVEFVPSIPRSLAGKVLRREFIEKEKKRIGAKT